MRRLPFPYRALCLLTTVALVWGLGLPILHVVCGVGDSALEHVGHGPGAMQAAISHSAYGVHHPHAGDSHAARSEDASASPIGSNLAGHERDSGMPCIPVSDRSISCCYFDASPSNLPSSSVDVPKSPSVAAVVFTAAEAPADPSISSSRPRGPAQPDRPNAHSRAQLSVFLI